MQEKPVVLITGCSSGFGLLTALAMASQFRVVATMRDLNKKGPLLKALAENNNTVDLLSLDVCNKSDITRVINHISSQYGRLDSLVNNAGIALAGFFEELDDSDIRSVMETNVFGLMALTQAALPLLRQGKQAKIINISSIAGLTGTPSLSAYNASKWAVEGFSEALLFELAHQNIAVVCVEPGPFNTKIFHDNLQLSGSIHDEASLYFTKSQRLMARLKKSIDKGLDDPEKVAELIKTIALKKRPKFRYVIGRQAKIRVCLKRVLPFSWYQAIVTKALKNVFSD